MKPLRVTVKRGKKLPEKTKLVSRLSRFGNPFKPDNANGESYGDPETHRKLVALFREWIGRPEQADLVAQAKCELKGFNLACSCAQGLPCHADVWLAIVNGDAVEVPG